MGMTNFKNGSLTKEELFLQKEWLRKILIDDVVKVTFTKVSGDKRVMKCTLQEQFLPAQVDLEETIQKKREKSDTNMSVWDIEAKGWRSFRIENLISVEVNDHAPSN